MKVLELFACAGGASRGLVAAGNQVIATDIDAGYLYHNPIGIDSYDGSPHGGFNAPVRQPWEWIAENALSTIEVLPWQDALDKHADWADWIWASPPCQLYSVTSPLSGEGYEDLVSPVRERLLSIGKPYVIENVPEAPLVTPLMLCGCMFYGLRVYRPRHFESNLSLAQPDHYPHKQTVVKMGRPAELGKRISCQGHVSNLHVTRAGMGYDPDDLIPQRALSESIPPHFAFYIAQEMNRLLS